MGCVTSTDGPNVPIKSYLSGSGTLGKTYNGDFSLAI
uniref:Uncharacterized protein n=1 Tax=viral metagenome TaxID=1070528 RepID=A0A6C0AVH8_9ZZZZ